MIDDDCRGNAFQARKVLEEIAQEMHYFAVTKKETCPGICDCKIESDFFRKPIAKQEALITMKAITSDEYLGEQLAKSIKNYGDYKSAVELYC